MSKSRIKEFGINTELNLLKDRIIKIYKEDDVPWVIGYSGGKDSTAVLQLVWMALEELPVEERTKTVHVITTDTLVENPIVAIWVDTSLRLINSTAKQKRLPILAHKLIPKVKDTFWVNLIGKGYPAPRPNFRWCTDRLKISPSNDFITNVVQKSGEVILVLGTRSSESSVRAAVLKKHASTASRDFLNSHTNLPNCLVFPLIKDWSNDDVWLFLNQIKNPWGHSNKDLMNMYAGATADSECPLVVDTSTPSCGDSRFGCWVCTMVSEDKSMSAMIQNDSQKNWMRPLLKLRNELDIGDDRHLRDYRRMHGGIQFYKGREVPGPYTQESRLNWLEKVLQAQEYIRKKGPKEVQEIELISMEELHEIRRMWVHDKNEVEDLLPEIYYKYCKREFPSKNLDLNPMFKSKELQLLKSKCDQHNLSYEMVRNLLSIEHRYRTASRRVNIFKEIEKAIVKDGFESKEEALRLARKKVKEKSDIQGIPSPTTNPEEQVLSITSQEQS